MCWGEGRESKALTLNWVETFEKSHITLLFNYLGLNLGRGVLGAGDLALWSE